MKFVFALLLLAFASTVFAELDPKSPQGQYERSIDAVVRNKYYYKSGKFELGIFGGVMPYDSLVNHYMGGARLSWHFADHYGWEVIDAGITFPSVTSFSHDIVQAKGISNLQTSKLKLLLASNFLLSPIYGKVRLFGSSLIYYDIYFVLGGGFANTETLRISTTAKGVAATETSLRTGMEPMFDFGIGFKLFLNPAMTLILDLRDYVVHGQVYGKKALKSNYSVYAGLSFFLPTF